MSGLEAVGAAASIVGLAQAGLGLAKALNEYVGAVSDANDDIAVIADDIYATYRHLSDLAWVLKQNETTKCMTEDAVTSAQTCAKKAEVLVQKLRKLLVKGGGSSMSTSDVQPDDIDITKFRKGIWYIYKSEFELRQAQLHAIKTDISMVYLGYLAMSGASANERKQATEEMELLFNRQTALNRGIQKARRKRDRVAQGGANSHARGRSSSRDVPPDYSDEEEKLDEDYDGPEVVYDTVEDVYKEFDNWLAKKQKIDADKAATLKKTQEDAVAQYLDEQKDAAKKATDDMEKLRKALDAQGIPPGRVGPIVRAAFPEADSHQTPMSNGVDTSERRPSKSTVLRERGSTRKSSWFRRPFKAQTDEASSVPESVPDVLKDSASPGGLAQLKALYFQKITIAPGWTEIAKLDVAVPDYRFVPNLLPSQSQVASNGILSPFLSGFAEVPEDYRYHIVKELTSAVYEDDTKWTVLQIEPVKSQQSRLKLSNRSKKHLVGIYVILRKVSAPSDFFRTEAEPNLTSIALPEEATAFESVIGEPTGQSATKIDYIPEQAETYVSRTKSKEKEPELVYASNMRGSEYGTGSGTRHRSGSPHVSFANDYVRTAHRGNRNRSRYIESSDESDDAGTLPVSYTSHSRPDRGSAAPSDHPGASYRRYEARSSNRRGSVHYDIAPIPVPRRSGTMTRERQSPSRARTPHSRAAELTEVIVEKDMDVSRRRYSPAGRATYQSSPLFSREIIPVYRASGRKSRSRSRSRSRKSRSDYHGHVYSDSDDGDGYHGISRRSRSRDRRSNSPRRREYSALEIEEKLKGIAAEIRVPARLKPEATSVPSNYMRTHTEQYEITRPVRVPIGGSQAHQTTTSRRSIPRASSPTIYHYGTRANSRPQHRHSRSPTGTDYRPVTSRIDPISDLISEVSSFEEDDKNTPTSWPRISSKEAVRNKLESWTNKAAQVSPKEVDPVTADDMPPTGPLSRRTTLDVGATEVTAGEPPVDPTTRDAKKTHVESGEEDGGD